MNRRGTFMRYFRKVLIGGAGAVTVLALVATAKAVYSAVKGDNS